MPTSVHIPAELLSAADERAKALGISRNRLIVQALARELREGEAWSPGFFGRLSAVSPETASAADELLATIRRDRRSRKGPPRL